jgi:hypothetical protein
MSEGIQGRVCLILCQTTFGDSGLLQKWKIKSEYMKWLHLSMFSFDIRKCFRNPTQHSHFIQSMYSVIEM